MYVPGLCANAADTSTLLDAGLKSRHCVGVVALTNEDHVNLKVAITSKLLNPKISVICRAESQDEYANMASFGTDHIINPFDTFAEHLAVAIDAPGLRLLHDWLTSVPQSPPQSRSPQDRARSAPAMAAYLKGRCGIDTGGSLGCEEGGRSNALAGFRCDPSLREARSRSRPDRTRCRASRRPSPCRRNSRSQCRVQGKRHRSSDRRFRKMH